MKNLDFLAAKYGLKMVAEVEDRKKLEKNVTSALNILSLQGLFAMFLWLHAKPERHVLGRMLNDLLNDGDFPCDFAGEFFPAGQGAGAAIERYMQVVRDSLLADLGRMYFVKEIINLTLVYARHGAKTA